MEKPILFSSEMVRAILDGRKTQTRRVIMPQPMFSNVATNGMTLEQRIAEENAWLIANKRPYGRPGDTLWVREKHWRYGYWEKRQANKNEPEKWHFVGLDDEAHPVLFEESKARPIDRAHVGYHKRPSIFIPRWASRLTLRVVDVRIERVQEISEEDARAEGVNLATWELHHRRDDSISLSIAAIEKFKQLWDSINAKRGYSWDSNPWVWVVEFEVVK